MKSSGHLAAPGPAISRQRSTDPRPEALRVPKAAARARSEHLVLVLLALGQLRRRVMPWSC